MRHLLRICATISAFLAFPLATAAEAMTLSVNVSYRERIALPPDAQLEVQLLDLSRADAATRIASQRFVMTGNPLTVSLSLESGIITAQGRYGVAAAIWSGDAQIFRTMRRYTVVEGSRLPLETVELLLLMVQEDVESAPPPRRIAGVSWAVTEVLGRPTATEDPATLVIDSDMNFSLFGGCNRFNGRLIPTEDGVAFPETFAGTLMACPPGIEASERRLLEALRRVTGYVRYGGGLVMTDAQRAAVLHLEARPD